MKRAGPIVSTVVVAGFQPAMACTCAEWGSVPLDGAWSDGGVAKAYVAYMDLIAIGVAGDTICSSETKEVAAFQTCQTPFSLSASVKGKLTTEMTLFHDSEHSSCGMKFEPGATYTIAAKNSDEAYVYLNCFGPSEAMIDHLFWMLTDLDWVSD